MKKTILGSLFLAASASLFFTSTGQSHSAKAVQTAANEQTTTAETTPPGKANFSAKIDGVAVSGDQIDDLQLENTAFIYPGSTPSTKRLLFSLYSNKKGNDFYFLKFSIPDKPGSFTKKDLDGQPYDILLDVHQGDFSRYHAQAVTVTITSLTASTIKGTFWGTFRLSVDTARGKKKEVQITDGSFSIPFSTGNLKPE